MALISAQHRCILIEQSKLPAMQAMIPHAQKWSNGESYWVVPHKIDETIVLRNCGFDIPSPVEQTYEWPGQYTPFAHQIATTSFLTLNPRAFVLSDIGTGKTLSAYWAADYLMRAGKIRRTLVVSPLSTLERVHGDALFNHFTHRTFAVLYGAAKKRRELFKYAHDFYIVNYEGVPALTDGKKEPSFLRDDIDLVLIDECFTAGTLISTPYGAQPIETIEVGDVVTTPDGPRGVLDVSSQPAAVLCRVRLANGQTLECTRNHPFFTDRGWLCASDCAGQWVFSEFAMRDMRLELYRAPQPMGVEQKERYGALSHLLAVLRAETHPQAEPRLDQGDDGSASQSDSGQTLLEQRNPPYAGATIAAIESSEGTRAPPVDPWGQWDWDERTRAVDADSVTTGFHLAIPGSVRWQARRLSYLLQGRLRLAGAEAGSRDRREFAHVLSRTATRCKEIGEAFGTRVVAVEDIQPRRTQNVYNLQVKASPWYYANGCLVHNCASYRNAQTERWRWLKKLIKPHMWVWGMTGTPTPNEPTDAYGQVKLVNPVAVADYQSFRAFQLATMDQLHLYKWKAKETAVQTVYRVMQPAIRYTRDECLDLPDCLYETRTVEMSDEQAKVYKELLKHSLAEVQGGRVTALNEGVLLLRLLQAASGVVYDQTGKHIHLDCATRISALEEVIEQAGAKVLVFAPFRGNLDYLEERLSKKWTVARVDGETTATQRNEIFRNFQSTPDPHVLVMHPACSSHGLTLTAAATIVWWAPINSNETYTQACGRINRPSQTRNMLIVHLVGSEVERRVFRKLEHKQKLQGILLELVEQTN